MRRKELTPKEIVKELDQYIVGQEKAKKAVAIALRNRWRRQRVKGDIKEDILPNNIILIGPTGVGKTEIARRLANLAHAPFIKVEASKYTEVGYVGRDVESIIRDLTNIAVNMVKEERMEEVREQAEKMANERILDILLPPRKPAPEGFGSQGDDEQYRKTREKLREMLEKGELEDRVIEITVQQTAMPVMQVFGPAGIEEMGLNLTELLENAFPRKKKAQKVTVEEARKIFAQEEAQKLIDMDAEFIFKKLWESLSLFEKMKLIFSGILGLVKSRSSIEKEMAGLENRVDDIMKEVEKSFPSLKKVLVDERDRYMAEKLKNLSTRFEKIMAIVGDGHVAGIEKILSEKNIEVKTIRLKDLKNDVGFSFTVSYGPVA